MMNRRAAPAHAVSSITDPPRRDVFPRFLSVSTVARRLDVSLAWVRLWHKTGLLRGFLLHATPGDRGRLLFREADVRDFLAARGLPVDDEGAV